MIKYEKIDTFKIKKSITTEEIINLEELNNEIINLTEKILVTKELEYPKDASYELKGAIDSYNEPIIADKLQTEELLEEKKNLLKEINYQI